MMTRRGCTIWWPGWNPWVTTPDLIRLDRNYARRSALAEWIREQGYDPDEILIFEDDQRLPVERRPSDVKACEVCWRLWMKHLGAQDVDVIPDEEIEAQATAFSRQTGWPLPTVGKTELYRWQDWRAF